ncbi:MAG: hypothetical protein WCJ72_16145, partial [Chryseobacterium sp.]
ENQTKDPNKIKNIVADLHNLNILDSSDNNRQINKTAEGNRIDDPKDNKVIVKPSMSPKTMEDGNADSSSKIKRYVGSNGHFGKPSIKDPGAEGSS